MGEIVILTKPEVVYASEVGAARKSMHKYAAYEKTKRPDTNQQRGGVDRDSWDDVESANAEYAVAKFLCRFWPGNWWSKGKTVDISPDIEVRFTKHANGHLLLYDNDDPGSRYVLVSGQLPEFNLRGWAYGRDGMLPQYVGQLAPNRPSYFVVPHAVLRPVTELIAN